MYWYFIRKTWCSKTAEMFDCIDFLALKRYSTAQHTLVLYRAALCFRLDYTTQHLVQPGCSLAACLYFSTAALP